MSYLKTLQSTAYHEAGHARCLAEYVQQKPNSQR